MTRHGNEKKRRLKPSQIAIARGVLLFVLFFGFNLLWEAHEYIEFEGDSCEPVKADETPMFYDWIYSHLTRLAYGTDPSGHVSIIFIPEDQMDVQQSICHGRAYLAALIEAVQAQHPAAIVVDKYFSSEACKDTAAELASTKALEAAVTHAQEQGRPVIVGAATDSTMVRFSKQGARKSEHIETCLMPKRDGLSVGASTGLTKLNANREQIPLSWPVLAQALPKNKNEQIKKRDEKEAPGINHVESLALVTARKVAAKSPPGMALHYADALSSPRQPYANLNTIHHLDAISSNTVLTKCVSSPADEAPCYRQILGASLPVKDQVVVIGSQSSADQWVVLGEERWGYELQGAYVDALISGRYFKAVSGLCIFLLQLLFIFVLEAIPFACEYACRFDRCKQIPLLRRLSNFWVWLWIWPPLFVCIVFAVCAFLGYLPPLSVLIGALLIMLARILFDRMDYFQKHVTPELEETRS